MTRASGTQVREFPFAVVCLHDGRAEGPVEAWKDPESMTWGYTCHCGKVIEHDIRDDSERGAAGAREVLFVLFLSGLAFIVISALGRWTPGLIAGAWFIGLALWLLAIRYIIAFIIGATQGRDDS